jgi:hypothetical protein
MRATRKQTLCRHFTASVLSTHQAAESRHAVKRLRSFPDHNSCVPNNQYLNNSRTKKTPRILPCGNRTENRSVRTTAYPLYKNTTAISCIKKKKKKLHVHGMVVFSRWGNVATTCQSFLTSKITEPILIKIVRLKDMNALPFRYQTLTQSSKPKR